jgi:hypothetical protein
MTTANEFERFIALRQAVWRRVRKNTHTVALRVVRGDGKGTQCPGVKLDHHIPGGYKHWDLALQVGGVSKSGTIKYDLEPAGLRLESDLAGDARQNSKLQTRPLAKEGAIK